MEYWSAGVLGLGPTITPILHHSNFDLLSSILNPLTGNPARIFVVMLVVPVRDLPSRCAPDSFM
jgi:hypothetical protein